MSLSQEEILRDINTRNISGVLLREKNFTNLLGEIEYSETGDISPSHHVRIMMMMILSGQIVGAKVTSITLLGKVNLTALEEFGSAGSRGDVIDKSVLFWRIISVIMTMMTRYTYEYEGEMVEVATDRQGLASGVEIYVNIARMLFETLEGQVFKVFKTKHI